MKTLNGEPQTADLRAVLALLQQGTVTRASRSLGMSQSSLSHHLERMRSRFADELFVRIGNQMAPTPFAERLGNAAAKVLGVLDHELGDAVAFDPSTTTREFRIGLNEVGAITLLPKLARALALAAPHARMAPVHGEASDFAKALGSGGLDLAVGYFDDVEKGLIQQLLYRREYVCVARLEHPKIGRQMSLEAFADAPKILTRGVSSTASGFELEPKKERSDAAISVSGQQVAAIPFIVSSTHLIALIPREVYEMFNPIAPMKIVELPFAIPVVEIRQYWHPRMAGDAAVRFFREVVYKATR